MRYRLTIATPTGPVTSTHDTADDAITCAQRELLTRAPISTPLEYLAVCQLERESPVWVAGMTFALADLRASYGAPGEGTAVRLFDPAPSVMPGQTTLL